MAVVYVNIGSNLGDRKSIIEKAIKKISLEFGYYCLSDFVESEPWGFDSTNPFLNIGMAFKSELHPEKLLQILQRIEKEISEIPHRDPAGKYLDREIDIDIMAIDGTVYNSETLKLPHPHLLERYFFMKPLQELCPGWIHPSASCKF